MSEWGKERVEGLVADLNRFADALVAERVTLATRAAAVTMYAAAQTLEDLWREIEEGLASGSERAREGR